MKFIVLSCFYYFFPFVVFCFPLSLAVPQLSSPLTSLILIHFLPRAFPQIPFSFSLPLFSPCLLPVSISPVPFIPFPIFSSFLLSYSHHFFPINFVSPSLLFPLPFRFSISPIHLIFPYFSSFLLSYSLHHSFSHFLFISPIPFILFSLFLFLLSLLFPSFHFPRLPFPSPTCEGRG